MPRRVIGALYRAQAGGGDCPSVPNNLENFEGNLYFLPNFLWGFSHLSLLSVELSCSDILLKLRGVSVFMHWLTFHCCLSQQSWHSYLGNLPGNKLLLNSNDVEQRRRFGSLGLARSLANSDRTMLGGALNSLGLFCFTHKVDLIAFV